MLGYLCVLHLTPNPGRQAMLGYLNRPAETAAAVDGEGWLRTGDVGHYDQDGYFRIVDRTKELIKVKGFQVIQVMLKQKREWAQLSLILPRICCVVSKMRL